MFGDDSELRRILRLTPGSVPVSLRSFCNVWFWTGVRGSAFSIRKVPFYRFPSFQILAFDLCRERNFKHFRLEKIQIWSSESYLADSQSCGSRGTVLFGNEFGTEEAVVL